MPYVIIKQGDIMKTFHYQNKKNKDYFEGWYLRVSDAENDINLAFIFAVTKDRNHPHSFIQVYDGSSSKASYYTYNTDEFRYDSETSTVYIGPNQLSPQHVHIDTDQWQLDGTIHNHVPLQKYQGTRSAMGMLHKAPLECFQEIVFMDADATFTINGKVYEGKSYMEKTYGTNFPSKWVWLQSNHSSNQSNISFSVGDVPFIGLRLKGFLLVIHHNKKEYRFGTFNFSSIKVQPMSENEITITVKRGRYKAILTGVSIAPVKLVGPRSKGRMDLDVFETIEGTATLLLTKGKKQILNDHYTNVGLEIMY